MTPVDPSPPPAPFAPAGWTAPRPARQPLPTWWPAATAFGITLIAWGLIATPLILAIGAIVFLVSLTGWIGDLRHERKQP